MSIVDDLLSVPEREDGGRTAQDRFEYQTAWGLCRALVLHRSGYDWAIAFEYHDDIVELDNATRPTAAIFYQVKSKKSGDWSLPQITSRKTGRTSGKKEPSYAGKMFDNVRRFGSSAGRLVFVSNQPLGKLTGTHIEIPFGDVDTKVRNKFVADLIAEAPDFDEVRHFDLFHFHYSSLNLSQYETTLFGDVAKLLEEEVSLEASPMPFARYLNDYCRSLSKALSDVSDFDQLLKSKFLRREQLESWLAQAKERHQHRPSWESVARHLDLSFVEENEIEKQWHAYSAMGRQRVSAASLDLSDEIKKIVDPAMASAPDLMAGVMTVFDQVKRMVLAWSPGASDAFIKAVILYEFKR